MARKTKKKAKPIVDRIGPTLEQLRHCDYVSAPVRGERTAAMVYRKVPIINTMLERGDLTKDEHRRLAYYREQAQMAERSPVKSCLDDTKGGAGGHSLSAAVTSAIIASAAIDRQLGSLADIARAIAVDDLSLSQWCVNKFGGRERYNGRGEFIAVVPVAERRTMGIAKLELKMAAHRIVP